MVGKEGGEFWVDSYVIPVGAKNPDAAHKWIDYVYEAEAERGRDGVHLLRLAAEAGAPEGQARPEASSRTRAVFPPTRTLAKLEPNNVSAKGTALRSRIWTEFKNA